MCPNYLCGFCPEGTGCKFVHPRFDLPTTEANQLMKKGTVVCHYCNEVGHKIYNCTKMTPEAREDAIANKLQQLETHQIHTPKMAQEVAQLRDIPKDRIHRPLDQVTCFKCGEKGHYANKCPKGHLAFLSTALKELQTKQ
jgi:cleavage and polyadenylation specificity factor subunit 4